MKAMERWLASENPWQIGEIRVEPVSEGYLLCHQADAGAEPLRDFHLPTDARHISANTETGVFRPLKSAPTLRRGWRLILNNREELLQALDYFYPAALALHAAWRDARLEIVPLSATLGRQSGMYAVTRKITSGQADEMVGSFCASSTACLKTILWEISPNRPVTCLPASKFNPAIPQADGALPFVPLLCQEACNLLVAQARQVVKGESSGEASTGVHG